MNPIPPPPPPQRDVPVRIGSWVPLGVLIVYATAILAIGGVILSQHGY